VALGKEQQRWQQIEDLFLQTIEIPLPDRAAFLRDHCGADDDLLHEVESLIRRDELGDDERSAVIIGIIGDAAAGLMSGDAPPDNPPPDNMVGSVIGNYRVIREIGRGGMGGVYLAVRADLTFEKQVAIKLVKRGIDTDAVLKRFWYERRILAALDHPYIARLIDGGTSPDGRPYFVMEYVDGKPLDVSLRESALSIEQRCQLFRKICEAVAYAHRNLIIHRDIKPANILVTADGTPKLLDFGIARLLSVDPGENTIVGTASNRALTPKFASPEQISGGAVTTATDVYSLGVTLRTILTMSLDITPKSNEEADIEKAEENLPSDLRTVLRKATCPEPERRYASVADFSEDLRRYVEGLPIQARDPTWSYQAMRFVQRHRAGVAAAVLFNILIVVGIGAILKESRQAERERRSAQQRLGLAVEMANRTLANVNGTMAQLPGTTDARRQIVRSTEEYLDQLARDSGNDPRVLAALGTAYVRVGEVQGNPDFANLGDTAGSLATYRKALSVVEPLLQNDRDNRQLQELSADAHLGLASLLNAVGSSKESETEYRAAIEIASQLLAAHPADATARLRLLNAHLVALQHFASDQEGAEKIAGEYLPDAIQLAAENPDNVEIQLNLAGYYNLLGNISRRREALQDSLTFYRESIALREAVARKDPRHSAVLRDLAVGYGQAGDILGSPFLASLGDLDGALKYFRKEEKIIDEMSRSDPSDKRAHYDLGLAWMRIGGTLQAKGDLSASNQALDRALEEFGALQGAGPDQAPYLRGLELVYEYRGRNSWKLGDRRDAIAWYRKSLELASAQVQKDPHDMPAKRQVVAAEGPVAVLLALEGDSSVAHQLIEKTLRDAEGIPAIWKGRAWNWRGQLYQGEKDYPPAKESFEKAIAIWKSDLSIARSPQYGAELREAESRLAVCRRALP
jgi:tetratricopeptide (TPR) repeat protein